MQVLTNTDKRVHGDERLAAIVETVVTAALERFTAQITRVEVHLSDENGSKGGGNDKRCVMEARVEGRPPTAVSHKAATVEEAMHGAADKLARSLESTLGRLREF
ncbi:MAG TPA: HPF/RaiA family ribosome-associated protein [Vicinamibacterales bacterium]|nr:HPF/RaiA family ribosome-associated protein [Vicinamibacterales bacterium]